MSFPNSAGSFHSTVEHIMLQSASTTSYRRNCAFRLKLQEDCVITIIRGGGGGGGKLGIKTVQVPF